MCSSDLDGTGDGTGAEQRHTGHTGETTDEIEIADSDNEDEVPKEDEAPNPLAAVKCTITVGLVCQAFKFFPPPAPRLPSLRTCLFLTAYRQRI